MIHQNGSLLRKYAYLSNDSSYSVALEDGVDVTLLDKSSSNDEKKSIHYMHESSDTSNISSNSQNDIKRMQSFTFETQVSDLSIPDLLQIRFSFDMFSFSVLLWTVVCLIFCLICNIVFPHYLYIKVSCSIAFMSISGCFLFTICIICFRS